MTAIAHPSFTVPSHDEAKAAPAVGRAVVTAGKFVGNLAVALATVVLLGADADL